MAKKMRKKPRKAPGLLGHVTAPRYYDPPGPAPRETLAYLSAAEKMALLGMTDGRANRGPRGIPSFADDSASSMGVSRGDASQGTIGSGSDPGPNGGSISRSSGGSSPSNAGGGGSPSGMSGGALNSRLGGSLAANFGMNFNPGSPGYGSTLPGSFGYPASGPSQFSKDNAAQMAAMKAEREALQRMVGFTNAGAFPSVPLGGFPAASTTPSAFAGAFPSDPRLGIDPKGISNLPGLSGPNMGLGENPAQPGNYTDPTNRISGVYSAFGTMPGSAFSNTDYTGLNVNPTLGAMNPPAQSTGPVVQVGPGGLVFNGGRLAMDMPGQGMLDVPVSNKAAQIVAAAPTREAAINGLVGLGMARDTAEQYVGPGSVAGPPEYGPLKSTKYQDRVPPERLAIDMPGLGPLDVPGGITDPTSMPSYSGPFTPDERQGTSFPSTPASPPIDAPRGGFAGDYSPSSPSPEGGRDAPPDQNIDMNKVVNDLDRLNNFARMNYERVQRAIGNRDPNGAFGGQFAGGGSGLNRGRRPIQPPTPPTMPSTEELNSIYLALQAAGATPDELAAVLAMMNR